jgi:hypothetical protein
MALALLIMLLVPDKSSNLRLLALAVLAVYVFASLQDVSDDALADGLLPAKECGVANGFMYESN